MLKFDIIKIDVEGMELNVLRGMRKTLRNASRINVLVEITAQYLERQGQTELDIYSEMKAAGFLRCTQISSVAFELDGRRDWQTTVLFTKS